MTERVYDPETQDVCTFNGCVEEGISAGVACMTDYICRNPLFYRTIKGPVFYLATPSLAKALLYMLCVMYKANPRILFQQKQILYASPRHAFEAHQTHFLQ